MTEVAVAWLRRLVIVGVFACAGTIAARASAQSAAGAAEALFDEGRKAMQDGDLDVACQRFRESNRLDRAAGTELNLAVCEEKRGKLATAWELFRSASEALPAGDSRIAVARDHASALDTRLPRLTIALAAGAPPDTIVLRDDVELRSGSLGVPIPVDPGKHHVSVRAAGHTERGFDLDIAEGERKQIDVSPGPIQSSESAESANSPPPSSGHDVPPPRAKPANSRRTLGFVAGGIGIVGVGVGTVAGIMTLRDRSVVDEHCNDALRLCDAQGRDAADRGRTLGVVTTVGFVVGAVALPIGAYFILSGSGSESSEHAELGASVRSDGARLDLRTVW
jgi:hypothetical protein